MDSQTREMEEEQSGGGYSQGGCALPDSAATAASSILSLCEMTPVRRVGLFCVFSFLAALALTAKALSNGVLKKGEPLFEFGGDGGRERKLSDAVWPCAEGPASEVVMNGDAGLA
ncbi:hypothetical protein MJG53_009158 [Ovis ammon polii x Ovis aries]|uniref:Uncharacterized protein n=1 Tax=Ovis ammon polii x Ovis aries TaxID=2918886 RepID=A0ACB9UYT3_9CETA|nr:hypothetical protein MJG53_009158 [Ovis ammon polii x Ovis aries]